ncbi:hypothetical protein ABPG75_010437 [Micractinium tetrahymenae]
MTGRPKRKHTAPQRFGTFASVQAAEDVEWGGESSEEEAPARRRRRRQASVEEGEEEAAPPARRKRARKAAEASSGDEEEADSHQQTGGDASSSEGKAEHPAAMRKRARGGGSKRIRTAGKAAPAAPAKPWVPPLPAEPRSRGDMLSLLFACPALIDALLEPDGLRTITLVARDAASLAAALGARTPDMAVLWHQLARRCNPGLVVDATTEQALEVVCCAVKADPVRREGINKTSANREYRLTEKELSGLSYTSHPNPIFYGAAPVKMYKKLDILSVALRKFGSAKGLQAVIRAAAAKSAKAKETLNNKADERREEMAAALQELGLEAPDSYKYYKNKQIKAFISRGAGSAAGIAAGLKKEEDEARERTERLQKLVKRLAKEGITGWRDYSAALDFVNGTSKQSLAEVVKAAKAQRAEQAQRQQREASLAQKLQAEGLQVPSYPWQVRSYSAYVQSEEGSEEAVLVEVRESQEVRQQRDARQAQVHQLLQAEGLQAWEWRLPGIYAFTQRGEGSTEALVEAARGMQQEEQQRTQRRTHMQELLAAEGLQAHESLPVVYRWIQWAEGSEPAALEAARQEQQAHQAVQQRRADTSQRLAAEGLEIHQFMHRLPALSAYIHRGEGRAEAALQAAREARDAGAMAEVLRQAYAV